MQMANDMAVDVEVFGLAADEAAPWLVSGERPWRTRSPIPADSDPHSEVELLLTRHGVKLGEVRLLHSTSWRADVPRLVLTYVAILDAGPAVRARWPQAEPITRDVVEQVWGIPPTHAATQPPEEIAIDSVLEHVLRHTAYLLETDATAAAALDETWCRHLAELRPVLANLYAVAHSAA
jgi:hypothetical protein